MKKYFLILIIILFQTLQKKMQKIKNRQRKLAFYTHPLFVAPVASLGVLTAGHFINKTAKGKKFFEWLNKKHSFIDTEDKLALQEMLLGMDDSNLIHNKLKLTESQFQILQIGEDNKLNNIIRIIGDCETAFVMHEEKYSSNITILKDNGILVAGLINKMIHKK